MKSAVIATVSVATMASAHELEARAPGSFGVSIDTPFAKLDTHVCGGVSIRLPFGIGLDTDGCPSQGPGPVQPPPQGCVDVWHPGHVGVVIDDCSDTTDQGWHFVVPCDGKCQPATKPHHWGTTVSTIFQTEVATVTACPSTVTDCPARSTPVTTVIVRETTSVCPVPIVSSTSTSATSTSAVTYVVQATDTAVVTVPATRPYVAPQPVETEECDEDEDDVDAASANPAAKPASYNAQAPADKSSPSSTYNSPASNNGPASNNAASNSNSRNGASCTPGTYGCPRPSNSTVPAITAGASSNAQMAGVAAMGFVVSLFL